MFPVVSTLIFLEMLVTLSFSRVSEENIREFQAGVDALIKESQNYTFEEKNFDTNLHVESGVQIFLSQIKH